VLRFLKKLILLFSEDHLKAAFNIDINIKCFLRFQVISRRSCDTKVWSNDEENSALIAGINYI